MLEYFMESHELIPELAEYLEKGEPFDMIRHPLVFSVPHSPMLNGYVNMFYKQKKEQCDKALEECKFNAFVFYHEKPYRLEAFSMIEHLLSNSEYWQLLGEIWIGSENIWQNKYEWAAKLKSHRPGKSHMMTREEMLEFSEMQDQFTIYRGHERGKNEHGLSWTTDKEKAKWFAKRFRAVRGGVATRIINKTDVVAFFNRRGESEIVIL